MTQAMRTISREVYEVGRYTPACGYLIEVEKRKPDFPEIYENCAYKDHMISCDAWLGRDYGGVMIKLSEEDVDERDFDRYIEYVRDMAYRWGMTKLDSLMMA